MKIALASSTDDAARHRAEAAEAEPAGNMPRTLDARPVTAGARPDDGRGHLDVLGALSPDVLFTFRRRGDGVAWVPYASAAVWDVLGLRPEDVVDDLRPFLERVHPDDADRVVDSIRATMNPPRDWRLEFRVLHPERGERWVEGRSTPVVGADGVVTWYGVLADVTARKHTKLELTRQKHLLEQAERLGSFGSWEWDAATGRSRWSDHLFRMHGLEPAGHGPSIETAIGLVHPEDRARLLERVVNGLAKGEGFEHEYRIVRGHGEVRWFHCCMEVIAGEQIGLRGIVTDVTERRLADEALRRSQARLRAALERGGIGTWVITPKEGTIWWDDALGDLVGRPWDPAWTLDEIVSWYHPEDARRLAESLALATATGVFAAGDFRYIKPDGEVIWLTIVGHGERDARGDVVKLTGATFDVTQRKRTEQLFAVEGAISRILNEADTLEEVWPAILRAFGELVGWRFGAFWEVVAGSEVLRCVEAWAAPDLPAGLAEGLRGATCRRGAGLPGEVWASGTPIVRPPADAPEPPDGDAGLRWHLAFPLLNKGRVEGVVELARAERCELDPARLAMMARFSDHLGQFLARRRAEEAVRRFTTLSPAVSYALRVDDHGVLVPVWSSDNLEAMTGDRPADAASADWWPSRVHPDDLERARAASKAPDARGEVVQEYRVRRRDGSYLWVRDAQRHLYDEQGRLAEVIGIWSDVTERVHLEAQLRQAQKMEAIGLLAGGIAHDFNNLLTVISGGATVLADLVASDDACAEIVAEIAEAAGRAASLTRQLLVFSRRQVMAPQVLDLNEVVTRSISMLKRLIGEHIQVECALAARPGHVRIDAGQMEQVILNLCVNARDAMPQGGSLVLSTRAVHVDEADCRHQPDLHPGDYVVLAIADTGTGMSPEVLARAFDPFFTTKPVGRGTGLGLATVFGIVRQAEGRVTVRSEVGRGSCFEVFLPLAGAGAAPATARAEGAGEGCETVLLVEDEPAVRRVARRSLEGAGYTVLEAPDGPAALELHARHGDVDLLVTDAVMPKMCGREVAEALRARQPGLRVLFLSGYTDDETLRTGVLAADEAFLPKPFSPVTLSRKVREVLDAP